MKSNVPSTNIVFNNKKAIIINKHHKLNSWRSPSNSKPIKWRSVSSIHEPSSEIRKFSPKFFKRVQKSSPSAAHFLAWRHWSRLWGNYIKQSRVQS